MILLLGLIIIGEFGPDQDFILALKVKKQAVRL